MIIHLYALNYNEIRLPPYFFDHYDSIVSKYFIHDDGSTDGSVDYLRSRPNVELQVFEHGPDSYIEPATDFYNEAWKKSRGSADWVIVVNIDEHIYHPDIAKKLRDFEATNITAVRCVGWQMVSASFPDGPSLPEAVQNGVRATNLDKTALFKPSFIEEINFLPGRHVANPRGLVNISESDGFKLLHYKFLGFDYLKSRYAEMNVRRGPVDVAKGYGRQYQLEAEQLAARQKRLEWGARPVTPQSQEQAGQLTKFFPGCFLTENRSVSNTRGGLREIWTQGDTLCENVRHVYTTTALPGVVKAWYKHQKQVDNITVLSGMVKFALYDVRTENNHKLQIVDLSAEENKILTIPQGVWHGFANIGAVPLVLLHLNDRIYDWVNVDEEKIDSHDSSIPYAWDLATS
ncbi:MAG: hypothetical protein DI629_16365 [Mesorhizobium amorphae]|nr:MAG: hypothetical protein DI629_16365 [Mesorhizobium amorphae]